MEQKPTESPKYGTNNKVVVVGGNGQIGLIHAQNMLDAGQSVIVEDFGTHPTLPMFGCKDDPKKLVDDGYASCVISIPETYAAKDAIRHMEAGFKKILLDKPGAPSSTELVKVKLAAQQHNVEIYMNYQRKVDPLFASKLAEITAKRAEGFTLDYVSVYSCDYKQPPQKAQQPLNQSCHDFAMLLDMFEAAGDSLAPKSMKTEGIDWNTHNDTQYMVCQGHAEDKKGNKCLYEVKCGRVSSFGSFTEILIKMSKYDDKEDMYTPAEIKLRYPEVPDPKAFWSDVWKEAFIGVTQKFTTDNTQGLCDIETGVRVLRMAELCNISLFQGGRQINNIVLSAQQYPERMKWITLDGGAEINDEALVQALDYEGIGQVVACMAGDDGSDAAAFIQKYPHHPAVAIRDLDAMKQMFDKNEQLAFYYPAAPSEARDKRALDVLAHFPNSIMLAEARPHSSVEHALNFKKQLADNKINENRFLIGMHSPLHPAREEMLKQVRERKDNVELVVINHHTPKDPKVDARCYNQQTGGALLDCGVFALQQAVEIAKALGFDMLQEFEKDDSKSVYIKKTANSKVDLDTQINFQAKGVTFRLSINMKPGLDHQQQQVVLLKESKDSEGVPQVHLSLGKTQYPHKSNGVFLEKEDGSIESFPQSKNLKSSYCNQIEMCQTHLTDKSNSPQEFWNHQFYPCPSEVHSLDYNIYLLKIIEAIKTHDDPNYKNVQKASSDKTQKLMNATNVFKNHASGDFKAELMKTAQEICAKGKGILAADESTGTIGKRFDGIKVENTHENRQAYRELLFTTSGIEEYISGVIMFDETVRDTTTDGKKQFTDLLRSKNIHCGIKVDVGLQVIGGTDDETATQGLDGLGKRCAEYYKMGCRFAKWRAVLKIGDNGLPSQAAVKEIAHSLARYGSICQQNGLVPIIEPEILQDGKHSIDTCAAVSERVFTAVMNELFTQRLLIEGLLLKPNMITPGASCEKRSSPEEIAWYTVRTLSRTIVPSLPGVVFLSGGQSEEDASLNLNAMNALTGVQKPWALTFSYGRALQASVLKVWMGKSENVKAAQDTLMERAKANSLAAKGEYKGGSGDAGSLFVADYKY